MKLCAVPLIAVVVFLLIAPASAVVYVKWDSPGLTLDGKSWETAFHTIPEGVNAAEASEEVWVARGRYEEWVLLREGVRLQGGYFGSGNVRDVKAYISFIDGIWNREGSYNCTVTVVPGSVVDGFTIRAWQGVQCYGDCTVSNNTIIGVNYVSGRESSGVHINGATPLIANNTILDCDYGVRGSLFQATIVGNTIAGCGLWGIDMSSGYGDVINNTVVRCGNGISVPPWTETTVVNNIVAFNSNEGLGAYGGLVRNNCVYGNGLWDYLPFGYSWLPSLDESNISADPQFASVEYGDFHLRATSPCRDAGDASVTLSEKDIDGQARIDISRVDMGSDESYGEVYGVIQPRLVYVNAEASPGGDGTNWARAYGTIQEAVDPTVLDRPAEIWVAKGTYSGLVKMNPFVQLYGGFVGTEAARDGRNPAANVTTIQAPDSERYVYAVAGSSPCVVDGFAIRGGTHGIRCMNNQITIRNCNITGSRYGVECYGGNPVIIGNRISGNADTGLIAYGTSVTVMNNIISDNLQDGLKAAADFQLIVCNNTIVGNPGVGMRCSASGFQDYDGILHTLANNLVAFNRIGVDSGTWRLDYALITQNNVFGNTGTDYNGMEKPASDISVDPLFVDKNAGDYHLSPGSPCIDAGYPLVPGLPVSDIDVEARISGARVDIGADEYQSPVLPVAIHILPGQRPNRVNLKNHAILPVVVFSSDSFNATRIDLATVAFAGAPVARRGASGRFMSDTRDMDRDGDLDAIIYFETDKMTIGGSATSAALTGSTTSGVLFEGSDNIVVGR